MGHGTTMPPHGVVVVVVVVVDDSPVVNCHQTSRSTRNRNTMRIVTW